MLASASRLQSLLLTFSISANLLFVAILLMGFQSPQSLPAEISVQRLNIVDPDGKTIIAISNKEKVAAPRIGGKAYPKTLADGRELMAGMIFFNQEGDEMGGLLFNSFKRPDGKYAGIGHLSFDKYNDNQVIALQYNENGQRNTSGLKIFDRTGDGALKESFDLSEQLLTATGSQRENLQNQIRELRSSGRLGSERLFVGSKNEVAMLELKDKEGNIRLTISCEPKGEPKIEFYDKTGKVTKTFAGY